MTTETENQENDWTSDNRKLLRFSVCAVLIWCVVGVGPMIFAPGLATSGQFGDTFGAANALFSAFAVIGVIYTVLLQRSEIHETRKELARSAKSQAETSKAMRDQARYLALAARIAALGAIANARSTIMDVALTHRRQTNEVEPSEIDLKNKLSQLETILTELEQLKTREHAL